MPAPTALTAPPQTKFARAACLIWRPVTRSIQEAQWANLRLRITHIAGKRWLARVTYRNQSPDIADPIAEQDHHHSRHAARQWITQVIVNKPLLHVTILAPRTARPIRPRARTVR